MGSGSDVLGSRALLSKKKRKILVRVKRLITEHHASTAHTVKIHVSMVNRKAKGDSATRHYYYTLQGPTLTSIMQYTTVDLL